MKRIYITLSDAEYTSLREGREDVPMARIIRSRVFSEEHEIFRGTSMKEWVDFLQLVDDPNEILKVFKIQAKSVQRKITELFRFRLIGR